MALTQHTVKGKLSPIGNRVIVKNMHFGEQTTAGGIIILDDNSKSRGIHPRWAQVHSKGPDNNEPYNANDWVLIEHGRWTRSVTINDGVEELELRMIDEDNVLGWSNEAPASTDAIFGIEN